jgi:predicted PhzF superfamily epimerase YddE/YHI9
VVIAQGEQIGRPSFLHVEVAREGDGWGVRVGGGVRVIGTGTFRI